MDTGEPNKDAATPCAQQSPDEKKILRARPVKGEIDHAALFNVNREATAKVIKKAMRNEPTIDWLLANQDKVTHYFHQLGLEGKI